MSDLNQTCENCGKPCDDSIEVNGVGCYCCSIACADRVARDTHQGGVPSANLDPKFQRIAKDSIVGGV